MKQPFSSLCATLILATSVSGAALAQSVEPGLWRYATSFDIAGLPNLNEQLEMMKKQMASLPPEMQKMMQDQMQAMGVNLKDMSAQVCMTPEEASMDHFENGYSDEDCTFNNIQKTNKVWRGDVKCTGEGLNGSGTFMMTFHSKKHFTTEFDLDQTSEGPANIKLDATFVSSDCGSVPTTASILNR